MSAAADRILWVGRTCELRAPSPAAAPKIEDRAEPAFVPALQPQPAL
jgi:hypothetical protein